MDHDGLDDDRLLRLLGEVLDESDPVPPDAAAAARAADLGRLDAELADLVFDSLLDERDVTAPAVKVRERTSPAPSRWRSTCRPPTWWAG